MVAAFRRLPLERVSELRGRHAEHAYTNHDAFPPRPSAAGANDALIHPHHPILRRHHLDGSMVALYWDLDRATGEVDGCSWEEGQQLLQSLQDEAERSAPRYHHQWCDHDVIIWDNITTQHAASADFPMGERRTMWRCLLEGELPQPY
jgi:alpha-ketoglutarate-dependent taurine dioxygenase